MRTRCLMLAAVIAVLAASLNAGVTPMPADTMLTVVFKCSQDSVWYTVDEEGQRFSASDSIALSLPAGDHRFLFRKKGYEDVRRTLRLEEPRVISIEFTPSSIDRSKVVPTPGVLQVLSVPEGADVYVDSVLAGQTPFQGAYPPGRHSIKILKELYYGDSLFADIEEGRQRTLTQVLRPHFGTLELLTLPEEGVDVYIDSIYVGKTPYVNTKCQSKTYTIQFIKRLFRDSTITTTVEDMRVSRNVIVMRINYGEVAVSAPGSKILLDDSLVATEKYHTRLLPGKYKLKADRGEKYFPVEREIVVHYDERMELTLEPIPRLGNVSVIVSPFDASDAEILVSGELKGKAPLSFPLLIGDYDLVAKKRGFAEAVQSFTVREKEQVTLNLQLLTDRESRDLAVGRWNRAKWISAGTGVVAAGLSAYFYASASSSYDKYLKAPRSADAQSFRTDTQNNLKYFRISLGAAGAAVITSLVSWYMQGSY